MAADIYAACKLFLRMKGSAADEEVPQTVDACLLDLQGAGVSRLDTDDPLIRQAAKLYCKANIGFFVDSEKYARAYEHLKASLSLSGEYNGSF